MMDIRKRIFVVLGLALLLILLIVFLLFRKPKASAPAENVANQPDTTQTAPADTGTPTIVKEVPAPPPANAAEREKLYVVQLAKIFVERYMSYSNQDEKNGHITDVEELATTRMVSYIQTQTEAYSRDYKGVSTKVISSSLESLKEGKATVKLGIQQFVEEKGKNGATVYKNGTASLVKDETGWKVDGLFWEP